MTECREPLVARSHMSGTRLRHRSGYKMISHVLPVSCSDSTAFDTEAVRRQNRELPSVSPVNSDSIGLHTVLLHTMLRRLAV